MRIARTLFLLCAAFTLAGCGGGANLKSFLRDDVDMGYVTKVAVPPFENDSKDPLAAERLRGVVITQVLARGLFDVVDKGLTDSALRDEAVDLSKGPMDAAAMKRLAQKLNVQAFLMGTVEQAGDAQHGGISYPQLSLTLRLVDGASGVIFWQASGSKNGDSLGRRLLGIGSGDEFKLAIHLTDQLLTTLSAPAHKVKLPGGGAVAMPAVVPQAVTPEPPSPAPQTAPAPAPAAQVQQPPPLGQTESLDQQETPPPSTPTAAQPLPGTEGMAPADAGSGAASPAANPGPGGTAPEPPPAATPAAGPASDLTPAPAPDNSAPAGPPAPEASPAAAIPPPAASGPASDMAPAPETGATPASPPPGDTSSSSSAPASPPAPAGNPAPVAPAPAAGGTSDWPE
ncbi:MAG: hypothetical protein M0T76_03315 [Desulfobacteraceae bacterium]|nr:hypothetical protein [Desulfobacteraceae bacterium]